MKKLLIAGNCLFFCIAAVLGVLLYESQTREKPVQGAMESKAFNTSFCGGMYGAK